MDVRDTSQKVAQRKLELEWEALCRKHRRVERAFCVFGTIFVATVIKLKYWPPESMIGPQIAVLLLCLATSAALLPVMLYGSWIEWRRYKVYHEFTNATNTSVEPTREQRWQVMRDFREHERP